MGLMMIGHILDSAIEGKVRGRELRSWEFCGCTLFTR